MKTRILNYPNSRGSCPSKQPVCKASVALLEFSITVLQFAETLTPFPWALLSFSFFSTLSLGLYHLFSSIPFSADLTLRNHHGLRIFSITQKFFHYYKSSQNVLLYGGKQNMHGLSNESKVGRVSSSSLMAKSEGCREGWKT